MGGEKNPLKPKNRNCLTGVFDSSKEASGYTDKNVKNLNSLQGTNADMIRKTHHKW
jgi:hypothetical protein